MKIVVPYTCLEPGVVEAINADHELHDVSESDTSYWDLLSRLWSEAEDFCVIEQDIVVASGTLGSFERCSEPWCAATYSYLGCERYAGLGCTRFRAEIMTAHPGLMNVVAEHDYQMAGGGSHGQRHWCTLDAAMQRELWKADRSVHYHGHVQHLGDGRPSHGCC